MDVPFELPEDFPEPEEWTDWEEIDDDFIFDLNWEEDEE